MDFNGNGSDEFQTNRELLREVHSMVKDISKRADRFDSVMFGDKEAKQEGIVDKVYRHSKYISLDKKMKIFGTGLAASGGTGWAFWDTIKHFFK